MRAPRGSVQKGLKELQAVVDLAVADVCKLVRKPPFAVSVAWMHVRNMLGAANVYPITRGPNDLRVIGYTYEVAVNKDLFADLTREEQAETIIHEVAHIVVARYVSNPTDLSGHGPAWQAVMRAFGFEPRTSLRALRQNPAPRNLYTTKSATSGMATVWWTTADEAAFRAEVERRFRARTPPRHPEEADFDYRVPNSEMRTWAHDVLGKLPPETERDWFVARQRWWRQMARRAIRELDPEAAPRLEVFLRGTRR